MRGRIKGIEPQLDATVNELRQLEEEMLGKGMDPTSSNEYVCKFSIARVVPSHCILAVLFCIVIGASSPQFLKFSK